MKNWIKEKYQKSTARKMTGEGYTPIEIGCVYTGRIAGAVAPAILIKNYLPITDSWTTSGLVSLAPIPMRISFSYSCDKETSLKETSEHLMRISLAATGYQMGELLGTGIAYASRHLRRQRQKKLEQKVQQTINDFVPH